MSSERKAAANGINGKASRGPRTDAGKARARHNAFRHGLSTIRFSNPLFYDQIGAMAKAICESDTTDQLLFAEALQLAESMFISRCVRHQRVAAIERLRDGNAVALVKGDNRLKLAKARVHELDLAEAEIEGIQARFGFRGGGGASNRNNEKNAK